ncbi:hypothetical protein BN14_05497 [Rhizoctonia solani AG-1 IB]|uniref:Uncharacterized protein n=1 Tax=Thanatephorus cucumeris (strain AG1-IB / isolate 7/3/14) TaxID=1108050 RepID=M5BXX8_THACB|nr:hypothetical protein BN14_05497 [Rhizoctonia solani AG-1 IB]
MSSYPSDFVAFADKWVKDNQWPPENTYSKYSSSVLAMTGASQDGFTFHSGADHIKLNGYYRKGQEPQMVDASIHLMVPSWGEVKVMHKKTFSLLRPTKIPVEIDKLSGTITLTLEDDMSGKIILMDYDIDTPYGPMKDKCGLFPVDITQQLQAKHQALEVLGDSVIEQLHLTPISPGRLVQKDSSETHWEFSELGVSRDQGEVELLGMFLNDFSVKKSGILLPTYEDAVAGSKFDASEADTINAASKKSPFALEQSFFGIFVVSGTVDPENLAVKASLYVSVPLAGRVKITSLEGSLKTGVTAKINVAVASGSANLHIKEEGGKNVLYVNAKVKVRLVGEKNIPDTRLVTLPF